MGRRLAVVALLPLVLASCDASEKGVSQRLLTVERLQEPGAGTAAAPDLHRPASGQIAVAAYNVKNFLRMERWVDGKRIDGLPKPEKEVAAMVRVITDIAPDVLVLSEMGGKEDFSEFRELLAREGLDFAHAEHLEAADTERHVALLSKFPIVSRDSVARAEYTLRGTPQYMQRGILDVTLQVTPDYQLRVLGAHLKSKRPVPLGEALMRRNEAHLLRKHIDAILSESPNVNLLLAGDLNDTKNEPPIEEIIGVQGSPRHMADIWLQDAQGDRWTHYWHSADIYSRIDFIMVSHGLFREVDKEKSYVYRSPYVLDASDHRPVVAIINTEDR